MDRSQNTRLASRLSEVYKALHDCEVKPFLLHKYGDATLTRWSEALEDAKRSVLGL